MQTSTVQLSDLEFAMAVRSVTVNLSDKLYRRLQRAVARTQRSMDRVLSDAASALTSDAGNLPADLQTALAQMALLNDAALWQAARRTVLHPEQQQRLQVLHGKQQRTELTPAEQAEEEALRKLYRETQFVRAHAVVLLKARGYDVTDPVQFAPIL